MDLKFDLELSGNDDYGIHGRKEEKCYTGICVLDNEVIETYNCSYACLNEINDCYYWGELCKTKKCKKYSWKISSESACVELNVINKWRNTEMVKYMKDFGVIPLKHIIPKNQNCKEGYKKCGKINENDDYLCLTEDSECPINSLIIKPNNITPTGNYNYKSYKLGSNYLFYTNEKIEGYIATNLLVNFDKENTPQNYEIIDRDSIANFSIYNPLVSFRWYEHPSEAYLNLVNFKFNYTYQEMLKMQEDLKERNQIYSKENLEAMNLEVLKYKYILMGFGIAACSAFVGTIVYFIPIYGAIFECGDRCSCCTCDLCIDMTPMKRIIHLYLGSFPTVCLPFVSFILTIIKKITYNKYSSMKYINEYDSSEKFQESIMYNDMQFICLIIAIFFIIAYPILVKITSPKSDKNDNLLSSLKKTNNNNKICTELTPSGQTNCDGFQGETPYYA
jgi:hypothetical protein